MKVSLIVTTYNREDALLAGLHTVLSQSQLPDEILVADDGSGQATREVIQTFQRLSPIPVRHVYQEDMGFRAARIRNLAIAQACGDYLILMDGDMLLHQHFVADHCRHAQQGQFIQGGRILLSADKTEKILTQPEVPAGLSLLSRGVSGRHKMLHSHRLSQLFSSVDRHLKGTRTCNFSLWRADVLAINGFNEAFLGWGREDSEFVTRLYFNRLKRKKLTFNAIGFHLHHPLRCRDRLQENDDLLQNVTLSGEPRCKVGIDNHFGSIWIPGA